MGAGASRELELAQGQVKRLSSEMQRLTASLQARESKLSDVLREASEMRKYKDQLAVARRDLDAASADLRAARRAAHELPGVSAELQTAKGAAAMESRRVAELQSELQASRDELEETVGKLKYAEQEQRSLARKIGTKAMTEEQKQLAAAQEEAAVVSAQIVSEANSLLAGLEPHPSHPVFGRLLHDYGHKRLYSASPTTLWAGTTMWHKQRAFRAARAELIAKAKARSGVAGWPGAICVVETPPSAELGAGNEVFPTGMIVDGQHRLGAAHVMASQGKLSGLLGQILVEVYPPMEEKAVRELFTEINRMEPVTLVDFPEEQGGAGEAEESIITAAAETLRERFPAMFKPSTNCRPPHLNVDVLRNEMHKAGLIQRLGLQSGEQLVSWLEHVNQDLAALPPSDWEGDDGQPRFSASVLSKASREGFYLGLGLSWLEKAPNALQAGADARGEVGTSSAAGDQAEGVGDAQAAPQTDDQSASPAPAAKTRGKAKKEG